MVIEAWLWINRGTNVNYNQNIDYQYINTITFIETLLKDVKY